ncbi:uncharacterized protein [Musca autumnalis]|uniref:uncharacterized protein n=1 Tax=Musca autumnalis TaxID=221902 RepID=UPI003CF22400
MVGILTYIILNDSNINHTCPYNCNLRVIRRGIIALTVHVKLYQVPVNNVSVNLGLFKKANGYKPFLYNVSFNFCNFMANRKKYPFVNIFYNIIANNSNLNHTCPYDHDIIIKDLTVNENNFKLLPLPRGEYLFDLNVGAYNDWKANVKAYVEIRNDL